MSKLLLVMSRRVNGLLRRIREVPWYFDQLYRRSRLRIVPAVYVHSLRRELMKSEEKTGSECLITLTLSSRQFGNKDNRLEGLIKSFIEMTESPKRVEVFIKIDNDDDLIFFWRMKRKYCDKMNLRFILSDRGKGYADLHKYDASLIKLHSLSSRVWMLLVEDAVFVLPKWDAYVLSALEGYPHDCFIISDNSFEKTISISGPNPVLPVPVYWVGGSVFPAGGFGILKCTEEVAQKHAGWTSLGNGFNIDGFTGDLLRRLWQRHQLKLHVQLPTISKEYAPRGWVGVKGREELRTKTLLKFFSKEDQMVRDEMVDEIAKRVKEGSFK